MLKKIFIVFAAFFITASTISAKEPALRVMTFNIRFNNADDGENAWPLRKDIAASMVRFHKADLCGMQEALIGQINEMAERLPEYAWIGLGRDDGKNAGEFSPLFYRKDRLTLLADSTFWLSETPTLPGLGWDAACNRVVTLGKFKDNETNQVFYMFNTHFDHMGQVARRESSKLLLKSVQEIAGNVTALITGDFNSTPDSEPYQILVNGDNNVKFVNTKNVAQYPHHGPTTTWSGFTAAWQPDAQPIDYIFCRGHVQVLLHGTLSDTFDNRFPSDHMPVLTEVILE